MIVQTKPVISIASSVELLNKNGYALDRLDPVASGDNSCEENGRKYSCFDVKVCFQFDKATFDQLGGTQNVNFTIKTDEKMTEKQLTPRARIGGWAKASNKITLSTNLHVEADGRKCSEKISVFLQHSNDMIDKLTPIDISVDFALLEETVLENPFVSIRIYQNSNSNY